MLRDVCDWLSDAVPEYQMNQYNSKTKSWECIGISTEKMIEDLKKYFKY